MLSQLAHTNKNVEKKFLGLTNSIRQPKKCDGKQTSEYQGDEKDELKCGRDWS